VFRAGHHYHIYNRGNNRQSIFFERENYLYFLRQVRKYLAGQGQISEVLKTSEIYAHPITVVAYCLMPNHYHLLVRPNDDELSRHMMRLSVSYTKAVNKRYGRTGSLFQGQFRAVLVDTDEHLLHLSRYIHLNPVHARLVRRPEDWEFSSYRDYVGLRDGRLPSPEIVLSQFASSGEYRQFVEAYAERDAEAIKELILE
jgi:REP element-mobilizing transposase RayT